MEKKVVIAVSADNNYAIPIYVMLYSLLVNLDGEHSCDINIFVPGGFSDKSKDRLLSLLEKFAKCSITFHDMADAYSDAPLHKGKHSKKHITTPAYYRLGLASLLPNEDKCLYLDGDTIVCADVSGLFQTDLEGNYVAGVKGAWYHWPQGENNPHSKRLGIDNIDTYFNSGVTLFNLKAIREDGFEKVLAGLIGRYAETVDQDILNVACFGKIKILPLKYNFLANYTRCGEESYEVIPYLSVCFTKKEWEETISAPVIIHYGNNRKPWQDLGINYAKVWWEYFLQSVDDKTLYLEYLGLAVDSAMSLTIKKENQIQRLRDKVSDLENQVKGGKMDKNNCDIAVVLVDLVDFFSIKNGVDALNAEGISVDLIVPSKHSIYTTWRPLVLDEVYDEVKKQGYSPIREIDKSKKYKILLEPFPTDRFIDISTIDHEFRIRYKYSLISAKPNPVFTVGWTIVFDAVLCYTRREAELLSAYTKTFVVGPMKYKGFEKCAERPNDKPVLLYLPTFGDISSVDSIEDALKSLKDEYHIVVKAHHTTQHREDERNRIDVLKSNSDEYYDQSTDLVQLLKRVDVVLSDNSGSIFEAIYAEVPVAIYNEGTLNNRKLGNVNTLQYKLVEKGTIPYTDNINEVGSILKKAIEKREAQRAEKADFSKEKDVTKEFVDTMKLFLKEDRSKSDYYAMHDVIRNKFLNQKKEIADLKLEIESIVGSKAWKIGRRITAPYRFAKAHMKKKE